MRSAALAVSIATVFAVMPSFASVSDAAMAKLVECMKMKAATEQQKTCLDQVNALRKATKLAPVQRTAPVPQAAAAAVQPAAAKRGAPGATPAGAPAAKPKVIVVPPDVKQAAAQLGLAGNAPQAAGAMKASANIGGIGGGINVGDLKGLDLETAMMAVQSRRAELLEGQLTTQIGALQARNDQIAKLNELMLALRSMQPAQEKDLRERLVAAKVTSPAAPATPQQIDLWQNQVKGQIDSLNNSQQMDMLRMQSLTNKRNEAFDLMTNFIKKMADSRSSILGNMR